MNEKIYDIAFDSDGWSCRSAGILLGSFPSWLLAMGATRAAAEKDKRHGITATVRYQDLKGATHILGLDTEIPAQPPTHHDPKTLKNIDRLAAGQRPH
jgi:hypothetical protein